MRINERLHFVIPIYADDCETITAYVHSAPISRETFEAHALLLAKTFASIQTERLGIAAGPRIAAILLQKMASQMRDELQAITLMNEIRRLTNVVTRTPSGWISAPFQETVDRKLLSEDDLSEVTNGIVYFIVSSAMLHRQVRKEMLPGAAMLWGAQISPLDFTAFVNSLGTSITAESIGEKLHRSSVPY